MPAGRGRGVWRVLLTLLLLVSALGPSAGVLLAAYDSGATCGMSCCKRSRTCCCHRTGRNLHGEGGLYWTGARTCPSGCRQAPGTTGGLIAAVLPDDATDRWVPPAARVNDVPTVPHRPVRVPAALFERPPPVL